VQSVYRWQGKIVKDQECLLVMKSSSIVYDRLQQRIKEIHSYEVPEIISLDIENGYAPYLEWLNLALK
jgi:periplasmic divalent cation tolerance protein